MNKALHITTDIAQGILMEDKAIEIVNFSIRWPGKFVAPETGTYKLGTVSDDGSQLWVNGKLLIADRWSNHPMSSFVAKIDLEKEKSYDIKVEYDESTGEALYPFGHGLSYTNFEYSDLAIDKTSLNNSDELSVSVNIKNTGKLDGEEVVQGYIKDLESDKWMAIKQLREFERISLIKGENITITFNLDVSEDFRYYDPIDRQYLVETGNFEIQIGTSNKDISLKGVVTVN